MPHNHVARALDGVVSGQPLDKGKEEFAFRAMALGSAVAGCSSSTQRLLRVPVLVRPNYANDSVTAE